MEVSKTSYPPDHAKKYSLIFRALQRITSPTSRPSGEKPLAIRPHPTTVYTYSVRPQNPWTTSDPPSLPTRPGYSTRSAVTCGMPVMPGRPKRPTSTGSGAISCSTASSTLPVCQTPISVNFLAHWPTKGLAHLQHSISR